MERGYLMQFLSEAISCVIVMFVILEWYPGIPSYPNTPLWGVLSNYKVTLQYFYEDKWDIVAALILLVCVF